ncbi:MAG: hypothetical protein M4D80_21805 [Myxococcota bacterium]|nr:hypothetical protein [Deltaproteobacteria bacterium]MDQ3337804.1 hypothetical protein [Myxococcota bacterium]
MRALPVIVLLAACEDVPQPYDLDHARVMAVRIDPPAIAPGERATVEVLVTDSAASPYVATDVSMREVIAGPDPGVVLLDIEVGTADGTLVVQKALTIGARRDNPAPPVIATPLDFVDGEKVTLEVAAPDPALVYRWFSSVGDLTGFTTPAARLDPKAGEGFIVVVVRDVAGGTAWTIAPATTR